MSRRLLAAAAAIAVIAAVGVGAASTLTVSAGHLGVTSVASAPAPKSCTVTPSADAYADEANLLGLFGGSDQLEVRSWFVILVPSNRRAFVRFDLGSCAIPAAADVRSATLRLHLLTAPSADRTYRVHRVTDAWTEAALSWSAQPNVAASATTSISTGTTDGVWREADVRTDVAAMVAGTVTNQGWRLRDDAEDAGLERRSIFAAREYGTAALRPQLVVTWYD